MTLNTNRYDIKPIFRFVTVPVMILLGRLWAVMAKESINFGQFTFLSCSTHSIFCLFTIWISLIIAFMSSISNSFAFFALLVLFLIDLEMLTILLVSFLSSLASRCSFIFFAIFQPTDFTRIFMAILINTLFVVFSKWLDFLALGTSFRYDFSSHNQLPCSWLRLEPITAHTVPGSSYYTAGRGDFK